MTGLSLTEFAHLALSLGALLLLAKSLAAIASKVNIPPVMTEILLGVLIGPTFLATASPSLSQWLFPTTGIVGHAFEGLTGIAMLLLLFSAGLEMDLSMLKTQKKQIILTTLGSALIPFGVGFLLVLANPGLFGVLPGKHPLLAVFMGIGFSISALPVIIRILIDLGFYQSRIGVITVASASLMDIAGWTAFTLMLCVLNPVSIGDASRMLWSHATLLCFIAGLAAGNSRFVNERFKKLIQGLVTPVLSPVFFLSIGVKVNFVAHWDVALIVIVILAAMTGKVVGSFMGSRMAGLSARESLAIGFSLNVRGAMEMILARQALEAGLIQPDLFVALVVMALVTSLIGIPALRLLLIHSGMRSPHGLYPALNRPVWPLVEPQWHVFHYRMPRNRLKA